MTPMMQPRNVIARGLIIVSAGKGKAVLNAIENATSVMVCGASGSVVRPATPRAFDRLCCLRVSTTRLIGVNAEANQLMRRKIDRCQKHARSEYNVCSTIIQRARLKLGATTWSVILSNNHIDCMVETIPKCQKATSAMRRVSFALTEDQGLCSSAGEQRKRLVAGAAKHDR